MKKMLIYSLTVFTMLVASCSEVDEPIGKVAPNDDTQTHVLSRVEALKLASDKLDRPLSRGLAVNYDYVVSKTDESHPIAYIINYPNDEGWAVVSADDRVQEVLAYSDTGRFTSENQACKEMFLDNLEDYLNQAVAERESGVNPNSNDPIIKPPYPVVIEPKVVTNYSQSSPYNYYFHDENNKTLQPAKGPAGCGPVAVATVLTHIMDYWVYDNHDYYYNVIRSLYEGSEMNGSVSSGTLNAPPSSLSDAKYHVAKLLHGLSDEMRCYISSYDSSGNPTARATPMPSFPKFFNDNGFACSGWNNINSEVDIADSIEAGDIVIVYGSGADGTHVWVCSGAKYVVVMLGTKLSKAAVELHYDWGWGGSCNGYYSGKVLSPSWTFTMSKYLSIKYVTS